MEILRILEEDKINRHKDGKLFTRNDLSNHSPNLGNMFCIRASKDKFMLNRIGTNVHNLSFIIDIDYYENFVIAGGWFTRKSRHDGADIDIFIYRDHESTLCNIISSFRENGYVFSRRTQFYVQLESDDNDARPPVQIILRKYTSIAEILYGFDIGSSQMAYDGNELYLTVLSKFALETGYNIVDTSHLSPTYEKRLYKYKNRGYSIVFPYLPQLILEKNPSKDIKIGNFLLAHNENNLTVNCDINSEEYDAHSIKIGNNPRYATKINIQYLLGYTNNYIVDEYGDLNLTKDEIYSFYKRRFNLSNPNRWFYLNFDSSSFRPYSSELNKYLVEKTQEAIEHILNNYNNRVDIHWITENPGQQLTSSIKPLLTDPSDYYGKYYNPLWSMENHKFCSEKERSIMFLIYLLLFVNLLPLDVSIIIMNTIALFRFIYPTKNLKRKFQGTGPNTIKKRKYC
jgi:hypothetical protein